MMKLGRALAFTLSMGCAGTAGTRHRGELVLEVVTDTKLSYLEFVRVESGEIARIMGITAGLSEQRLRVRRGTWCLYAVELGSGATSKLQRLDLIECHGVGRNSTVHLGALRVRGEHEIFLNPR